MTLEFAIFTACDSCTWPTSTNPESTKAGELGLSCWTCFIASRLELVAVAVLLWFRGRCCFVFLMRQGFVLGFIFF